MKPLAERMRPQSIEDVYGQDHILAKDAILGNAIRENKLPSIILWGPPGVGKTSIAHAISVQLNRPFFKLSAISSGVKDVREVLKSASNARFFDKKQAILFIDEIHRFSKNQQDALLAAVEDGTITLIGATTENPSFEVNNALLSRTQVYTLKPLGVDALKSLLRKALETDEMLKHLNIELKEDEALIALSGGDARKLYNNLELVITHFANSKDKDEILIIDNKKVEKANIERRVQFDKKGEMHYDIISAFIKSVRGSDPQASIYWLARMIEGGEDEKFIARRLIILASEDIGLANPNALLMANQCAEAVRFVGFPEARIILSQATIYLATSPKSNSAYLAIDEALRTVREHGNLSVPLHLRNAPTKLMKELDYGLNYKYPHDFPDHYTKQSYLPTEIENKKFYNAVPQGGEKRIIEFLKNKS